MKTQPIKSSEEIYKITCECGKVIKAMTFEQASNNYKVHKLNCKGEKQNENPTK